MEINVFTGNDTPPITTTETPITIPPAELQIFEVQLILPEASRTNETWQKFKEVLASSASKYVTDQNLNYELAQYACCVGVSLNLPILSFAFSLIVLITLQWTFYTVRIIGLTTKPACEYNFP